ncbi:MAG: leucine-rich repeat domain-containing protein, partial [Synergistaceae bacterium]|nr:leucine-rich repeat domain-containing protein [Synergistaceae bacterium]
MIKKITIILLCVLLLAGVAVLLINRGVLPGNSNVSAPGNTVKSAGIQYDKWVYEVSDGNVILTAYTGRDAIPGIPTELNNMPVTALGDELFLDNNRIKEITIPDTIASMGTSIFENCSELTSVRLPNSLQRIPNRAFYGCKKLQSIQLPSGLKNIGASSFAGCAALTYVSIPDSVTSIGGDAFLNCTGIKDFSISKNLTNLGSHAFKGTPWLTAQSDLFVTVGNKILVKYNGIEEYVQVPLGITQITDAFEDNIFPMEIELPSSLTSIGPHAFSGCRSLETVNIPETVRSIGESAFRGCGHLGPVTLPARLTSIGPSAFQSCSVLERIVIPEGVKTLPGLSFANCENLRVLQIPESVTSIASDVIVYSGVAELRVIKGSVGENFAIENNIPYVYEQRANDDFIYQQLEDGIQIIMYTGNIYDVVIPEELSGEKVVQLSDILFQHNDFVRSVSLPETITRISDYSFANMSELRSVVFPETLTDIGAAAFMNDPLLSNLEIPESVIHIADDAFSGCTSLVIYAA